MMRIAFWCLFLIFTVLVIPSLGYAHNIPTVVHNLTFEYTERGINFSLNYRYDPIIVHRFLPTFDTNNDRTLSNEEKDTLAKQYSENISVLVDDQSYPLKVTSADAPQYSEFLIANEGVLIKGTIDAMLRCNEKHKVSVTDKNTFLSIQDDIYTIMHTNKDCFSVTDVNSVGNSSTVVVHSAGMVAGASASANDSWFGFTKQMSVQNIQSLMQDPDQGFIVFVIAIALAVVIGGLHALTPGHGKTLVAAYLVGQHGTVKDALVLGLVTTLTHTLSIYILGFLALFATQYFLPEKIIPALEMISAISILMIGVWLLSSRYRDLKTNKVKVDSLTAHTHTHGGSTHTHDLSELKGKKITLSSLISLGFSGGIVPCTDALAIMILAISLQQIVFGMILILFFSVGLAGVLIGVGIILVTSKTFLERFDKNNSFSKYSPLVSAVVITVLGLLLVLRAMRL